MSGRSGLAALALLPALFVVAGTLPGSWLWGTDSLRYLGPAGWASLAIGVVATAALWPVRGSRVPVTPWVVAVAVALLVLALPDRLHFVGDSLLRLRSAEGKGPGPSELFPQAFPLDLAVHWNLPRLLEARLGLPAAWGHRVVGALAALGLAAAAIAFVRSAGFRGAAALAAGVVTLLGGWLTLFTGLGKAFAELTVLSLALAAAGLAAVRSDRHHITMGALLAVALLTHRAALAFVPGALAALWLSPSRKEAPGRLILPLLLPALALAVVWHQLWESFGALDAANLGWGSAEERGRFFDPLHLLDVTQCALLYVPALVLFAWRPKSEAAAAPSAHRSTTARRERAFLAFFALPPLLLALLYLPPQGLFRDYDGLSAAGMALAVLLAHHLGSRLAADRLGTALAVAIWCALPAVWLLLVAHDPERGRERVERLATGPPARPALVRAHTWDFLGSFHFDAGEFAASARALERAVEAAPSPRLVAAWAKTAREAHDWPQAERAYGLLLARAPANLPVLHVEAHLGLASIAGRRGDLEGARRHLEAALALDPDQPEALRMLDGVRVLLRERSQREETAP